MPARFGVCPTIIRRAPKAATTYCEPVAFSRASSGDSTA